MESSTLLQRYRATWNEICSWSFIAQWWRQSWPLHAWSGLLLGMVAEIGKYGTGLGFVAYALCCLASFAGWTVLLALIGPLMPRRSGHDGMVWDYSCDDSDGVSWQSSSSYSQINPATGLFMTDGGVDTGGNPYGMNMNDWHHH